MQNFLGISTFSWTQGTYYFEIAADDSAISVEENAACLTETDANKRYAKVTVDAENNLSISVVSTDENNNETEDTDYAGTISVTAGTTPVNFTKDTDTNYALSFSNVAAGSTFSNLTGADIVLTQNNSNYNVTINDTEYTVNSGAAIFVGGYYDESYFSAVYHGDLTITENTYYLNSEQNYDAIGYSGAENDDGVNVVIESGVVTSVTGLSGNENFSYGSYTFSTNQIIIQEIFATEPEEPTNENSIYTEGMDCSVLVPEQEIGAEENLVDADFLASISAEDSNWQVSTSWKGTYTYNYQAYSADNTIAPNNIAVELYSGSFTLNDLDTEYASANYEIVTVKDDGKITLTFTPISDDNVSEVLSDFDDGESIKIGDVTYTKNGNIITRSTDSKTYGGDLNISSLIDDSNWEGVNMTTWMVENNNLVYTEGTTTFAITGLNTSALEIPEGGTDNLSNVTFDSVNSTVTVCTSLLPASGTVTISNGFKFANLTVYSTDYSSSNNNWVYDSTSSSYKLAAEGTTNYTLSDDSTKITATPSSVKYSLEISGWKNEYGALNSNAVLSSGSMTVCCSATTITGVTILKYTGTDAVTSNPYDSGLSFQFTAANNQNLTKLENITLDENFVLDLYSASLANNAEISGTADNKGFINVGSVSNASGETPVVKLGEYANVDITSLSATIEIGTLPETRSFDSTTGTVTLGNIKIKNSGWSSLENIQQNITYTKDSSTVTENLAELVSTYSWTCEEVTGSDGLYNLTYSTGADDTGSSKKYLKIENVKLDNENASTTFLSECVNVDIICVQNTLIPTAILQSMSQ